MQLQTDQLDKIADICRRYGVHRLQLFGSAAIGMERPDSDVDLLVEFEPNRMPSGFDLVDMQEELECLFGGRKVDLAFPSILNNPYRRRVIESQLRSLY
jgi:hypothetical protein